MDHRVAESMAGTVPPGGGRAQFQVFREHGLGSARARLEPQAEEWGIRPAGVGEGVTGLDSPFGVATCCPSSRCGLPLCSHHGQRSCLNLCRGDRRRKPRPGVSAAPEERSWGPWGHLGEVAGPGAGFLPVSPSDSSEGT